MLSWAEVNPKAVFDPPTFNQTAELERIESEIIFRLPADFRHFYTHLDGFSVGPSRFNWLFDVDRPSQTQLIAPPYFADLELTRVSGLDRVIQPSLFQFAIACYEGSWAVALAGEFRGSIWYCAHDGEGNFRNGFSLDPYNVEASYPYRFGFFSFTEFLFSHLGDDEYEDEVLSFTRGRTRADLELPRHNLPAPYNKPLIEPLFSE